jgi:hypothetical protein
MPVDYTGEPQEITECPVLVKQFNIWWKLGELEYLGLKSIYLMGFEKLLR